MMNRSLWSALFLPLVAIGALAVLTPVALGTGAKTDHFEATLHAAQEVPKPAGVPKGASGRFTATGVEKNGKETFTWRLTFSGLSGKAIAAHIHLAPVGKPGPIRIPLCGPCTSGAHGTAVIGLALEKALEAGKTYVNVHTVKNPAGEIRGQVMED